MGESAMEYDGRCAFAVMAGGADKAPAASQKHTLQRDGKTYGFSAAVPKLLFQIIPGSAARADRAWAKRQA